MAEELQYCNSREHMVFFASSSKPKMLGAWTLAYETTRFHDLVAEQQEDLEQEPHSLERVLVQIWQVNCGLQ